MGARANTLPDDRFQGEIINRFRPLSEVKTSVSRLTNTYYIYLISECYDGLSKPAEEFADYSIFLTNGKYKACYSRPYKHLIANVCLPDEYETREQALEALIHFVTKNLIKTNAHKNFNI